MLARGRVVKLDRGFPLIRLEDGVQCRSKHATSLVKGEDVRAVIGDFVMVDYSEDADIAQIVEILPRCNEFVRKDPSERSLRQVLAANFDTVIVAHPLSDLNIRRLERELVLAHETSAHVVVALTKSDLAESENQVREAFDLVSSIVSEEVAVLLVSKEDRKSMESLRSFIPKGSVAILIGKSGVGKSSLVNLLVGENVQETNTVREGDGKGRHTTVSRSMIVVRDGGLVVDMPGVRGLGLWESEDGIARAFPDVASLAQQCRFRDCKHENEPGCAVREAVGRGDVPAARAESFRVLTAENESQRQLREESEWSKDRIGRTHRGKSRRR